MSERKDWNELRISVTLLLAFMVIFLAMALADRAEGQELRVAPAPRIAPPPTYRSAPYQPTPAYWARGSVRVTVSKPRPFPALTPVALSAPVERATPEVDAALRELNRRRRARIPCTLEWYIDVFKGKAENKGECDE